MTSPALNMQSIHDPRALSLKETVQAVQQTCYYQGVMTCRNAAAPLDPYSLFVKLRQHADSFRVHAPKFSLRTLVLK